MQPISQDDAISVQKQARLAWRCVWKWGRRLAVVPLLCLIAGYFYHRSTVEQYRSQLVPEVDCRYTYLTADERYFLTVENVGLIDCDDVWVSEVVFLLIGGQVYEGVDAPHLHHFVYRGSRTAMWDLPIGETQELELAELQVQAFDTLHECFGAIPVCKWRIVFSKSSTRRRYSLEKSFIFDPSDRRYKLPDDFVGGGALVADIDNYLFSGSRRTVGIHPMTEQFEISPPREFMITQDYDFVPLYPGKSIPLSTMSNILLYSWEPLEIQPSDDPTDGSLRYAWQLVDGKWQKTVLMVGGVTMYSKRINLHPLIQYLSRGDREQVKANRSLLPDPSGLPGAGGPEDSEILLRARRKYAAAHGEQ